MQSSFFGLPSWAVSLLLSCLCLCVSVGLFGWPFLTIGLQVISLTRQLISLAYISSQLICCQLRWHSFDGLDFCMEESLPSNVHHLKGEIKSGWWFGTCFIFPYIGNDHPNWLIYSSEGLKPPTRNCNCNLFQLGLHSDEILYYSHPDSPSEKPECSWLNSKEPNYSKYSNPRMVNMYMIFAPTNSRYPTVWGML